MRRSKRWWLIALAGPVAYVALAIAFVGLPYYSMAFDGQPATATITALHLNDHGGCSYTYVADGKRYSARSGGCGTDHVVGDKIPITYSPLDHSESINGSSIERAIVATVATLILPAAMAIWLNWPARRKLGARAPANPLGGV